MKSGSQRNEWAWIIQPQYSIDLSTLKQALQWQPDNI